MPSLAVQVVHADLFVAERWGGWQEAVLRALAPLFNAPAKAFPPEALDAALAAVQQHAAGSEEAAAESINVGGGRVKGLGELSDKERKSLVMPFTKTKMAEAAATGPQVRGVRVMRQTMAEGGALFALLLGCAWLVLIGALPASLPPAAGKRGWRSGWHHPLHDGMCSRMGAWPLA